MRKFSDPKLAKPFIADLDLSIAWDFLRASVLYIDRDIEHCITLLEGAEYYIENFTKRVSHVN